MKYLWQVIRFYSVILVLATKRCTFCITWLSNTRYNNKGYCSLNLKITIFKLEVDIWQTNFGLIWRAPSECSINTNIQYWRIKLIITYIICNPIDENRILELIKITFFKSVSYSILILNCLILLYFKAFNKTLQTINYIHLSINNRYILKIKI